jgi:non-ribosomal peptide synthetase component F
MGENEIGVTAHFDQTIISRTQAERTLHQFEHVLHHISDESVNDNKTLGQIPTLSLNDYQVIQSWNTSIPQLYDICVHDLISQRAASQPARPAVHGWDEIWTFAELDSLSSRLAHHLRALGVGPEMMVPLCFERTAWIAVALIGIMKAVVLSFLWTHLNYPSEGER